jgi:hypothetical protein
LRVEYTEAAPGDQDSRGVALFRDRIDDATEKNGLQDRNDSENDVRGDDEGNSQLVTCKVFQGFEIDLEQGQLGLPLSDVAKLAEFSARAVRQPERMPNATAMLPQDPTDARQRLMVGRS